MEEREGERGEGKERKRKMKGGRERESTRRSKNSICFETSNSITRNILLSLSKHLLIFLKQFNQLEANIQIYEPTELILIQTTTLCVLVSFCHLNKPGVLGKGELQLRNYLHYIGLCACLYGIVLINDP